MGGHCLLVLRVALSLLIVNARTKAAASQGGGAEDLAAHASVHERVRKGDTVGLKQYIHTFARQGSIGKFWSLCTNFITLNDTTSTQKTAGPILSSFFNFNEEKERQRTGNTRQKMIDLKNFV